MPQKQMDSQNKQSTNLDKWAIIIFSNLEDHVRSYYKGVDSLSRLEEFLKWFYPQKAKLLEQFKQDLHDGKINVPIGDFLNMQFAAGFWLGTRYAAHVGSKFTSEKAGEFPRIIPPEKKDYDMYGRRIIREKTASAEFDARSGVFRMQLFDLSDANFTAQLRKLEYPAIVLMGFNLGLHEGTHALPYVFYQNISLRKPSTLQNILLRTQSLSELATSYSQSNYGLPIKSVDLNRIPAGFSFGARYAPHSLGPSSGLSNRIDYNREYFEHFLAPYLLPHLGGKFNLFNLSTRENSENIQEITGSLDAILGQAVRNRDRLLGKNKYAIAKLEEHAVRYCKYLSIEDPKTVQKVRTVFKWIQDYVSSHPKFDSTGSNPDNYQKKEFAKFASELLKVLENTFGKPEKIDVPNGYAYLDLHSLS